ncbi:MAG TPA: hypothetical protein VNH18_00680, partial [Bryobacteraceae bacterium]|nr:hypothetical protein [Bryobacteraceae bacterium]
SALVPQSVGAASRDTSINGTGMTPAEAQASRSTGEMQRLMTTPQPGDATEYVPGVKPTKAEIELSPSVSREAKGLRQEFREGFSEKEKLDNEVYHDFYDTMAGTPTIVERMDRERGAQAAKDLAETWKNKAPADVAPVLQAAQEIKASPDWRRPVVRNSVDSVIKELFDGDKPITDPEQLYGVRKYLSDLLSKEAARETPMATRAAASLMQLRSALDGVIEQAAPGFGQYLKNFQEASRPIDVMERLQKAKIELTNGPDRVITFGKFDRLLKNLVAERADPDVTLAAKAIPEDTMGKLFDMWRSIQRSASDQELAKTRGSDTTQMMLEMGKQGLGQVAATVVAPGLGNFLAPILGKQLGGMFAKRKVERHLHPDITPYQNRLLP